MDYMTVGIKYRKERLCYFEVDKIIFMLTYIALVIQESLLFGISMGKIILSMI